MKFMKTDNEPINATPNEYTLEPDGEICVKFTVDELLSFSRAQLMERANRVLGPDWYQRYEDDKRDRRNARRRELYARRKAARHAQS